MKISVIGGGSWGTAMAQEAASAGHTVTMLVRNQELAQTITDSHQNPLYLPNVLLHKDLTATTDPAQALNNADICLLAVPAQHLGAALVAVRGYVPDHCIPVCLSKGIEISTLRRMSEVVAEAWPRQSGRYAMLSGPSFAEETVQGLPTAVSIACADKSLGEHLREALSHGTFRIYSTQDVVGVELGGAVKNVIAIATGVSDGLGFGHNARAALITRGLAEICRLGQSFGANPATFMGLSGMGDLVLTCSGDLSRNRQVGLKLGQGMALAAILEHMHNVAEGVATTRGVCGMAKKAGVELPIAQSMYRLLYENSPAEREVQSLLSRSLKEE